MAKKKMNKSAQVRELLQSDAMSPERIAKKVGCTKALVHQIHKKMREESDQKVMDEVVQKKLSEWRDPLFKVGGNPVPEFLKPDAINPDHYKQHGIETIDIIEAWDLNYRLGNVVKYISRANHKGNYLEDLKKARWYLNREISHNE
jgi:hypothetical protein